MFPIVQPLPLTRRPEPFSYPDWLSEVKYHGFRGVAYADPSSVHLISRNGNRRRERKRMLRRSTARLGQKRHNGLVFQAVLRAKI